MERNAAFGSQFLISLRTDTPYQATESDMKFKPLAPMNDCILRVRMAYLTRICVWYLIVPSW